MYTNRRRLVPSNSKIWMIPTWCGNLKLGRNMEFSWPGKNCHEIMQIPQNKTRGEMQAYVVTITEARPKAKQEPCSFYVCNHALHGKITSTSLPHSGERRRARKHPYDALQDHTSTRSTLLLYVFSVCDDRWIRLSSKQTNASQTHTFWRVPKRLAYTTYYYTILCVMYACSSIYLMYKLY